MRKDTLARLGKLRAVDTAEAQAAFAKASTVRREAAVRTMEAQHRLFSETTGAIPVTYGTWLARQLALRQQARALEAAAGQQEDEARARLIEARREERVVERLAELRAEARRREQARREVAALDEAGARRRS